jgi:hypothetical protein
MRRHALLVAEDVLEYEAEDSKKQHKSELPGTRSQDTMH